MEKLIEKYLIEDLIAEINELKQNKTGECQKACDDIIKLLKDHYPEGYRHELDLIE